MSEEQLDMLADLLELAGLELALDQDELYKLRDAFEVVQNVKLVSL